MKTKQIDNVENILIVRQHNQLGDMLCSVPLFEALRKKYPSAHITLVASPINYEILFSDINPYIDEVLVYDKSTLGTINKFYKRLRKKKYQLGIVPSTVSISRTSHFINFLSGAKNRVGVKSIDGKQNKVEYLLNIRSDFNWDKQKYHQIERNLDIGRQIGCDLPEEERHIKIELHEDEDDFGREFRERNFPDTERLIVSFHPGAGKTPNRWSEENFVEVMSRLYKKFGNYTLITSGTIDREITDSISEKLTRAEIPHVVLSQTPIRMVGSVIRNTHLYITNDTGTMHVAAGVDANILALFGPTHGYEWGPLGKNKHYIQSETDNINDITGDMVFNKAQEILSSLQQNKNAAS